MLIILSGLPGSGKSTLGRILAERLGAALVRIDTIEQTLRDALGLGDVGENGYRLAYAVAEDNLRTGVTVIADSVNPIAVTRQAWHAVAERTGKPYRDVEVVCSDEAEHRARIEGRHADIPGLRLPTWAEVQARDYEPWDGERITVDTAGRSAESCVDQVLEAIGRSR